MRKVRVIASREYQAAVRTKAFVFSIVMVPVLWGASIGLQVLMKKAEDQTTKKVLDLLDGSSLRPTESSPSDDDWYLNLLWFDRRKACCSLTPGRSSRDGCCPSTEGCPLVVQRSRSVR